MAKKSGNTFSLYLIRISLLAMAVMVCIPGHLLAQDSLKASYLRKQQPDSRQDTTELYVKRDSVAPVITKSLHSPRKAAFYSAVLPGLGQIYNRQYWKLPLVYAALGITTGTFIFNMDKYRTYRDAYRIRMDGNADTHDQFENLYRNPNSLKSLRDAYREYVDYSVLVFVLAYGLNIVDATVFAHLKDFNMSDDLSIKVVPTIINNQALGLSLRVNIGKKKSTGQGLTLANRW
ncbi:DUF5683 domain-containing protein [Chitinophaga agri]|uniref:DUF5683 domain-containing protein n=1 Tax=Chitinophaga agri TaxID=2703787 RepID=A0A6B9ZMH6_9BACT|nr:DUF5683 domain-containing protein [Chitinophaga agri]QHS62831.1 hypothetical protein GWR21_25585 [Chitinophaga agri]